MLGVFWTVLAVLGMLGTFVACLVAVVVGIRIYEVLHARTLKKASA